MANRIKESLDPAASVESVTKLVSRRNLNRRNFVAALGVAGAATGTALLSRGNARRATAVKALGPTQNDVLNFALNLEYLEATYYSFITQGTDLPQTLTTGSGPVYNQPAKVTFPNQQITDLVNEIYFDELSHVQALRSVLGPTAISRPTLDLSGANKSSGTTAIATTATAALAAARLFEDLGASAYAGAATMLSGTNLTYAAQILAVEGFHSGALRLLNIQQAAPYDPTDQFAFKGNTTTGNSQITTVSAVSFQQVGQVISGPGIPAGTTITSYDPVGLTINMSAAATATGSQVALMVFDSLDVKPGDPGTAARAAAGPAVVAGTSTQYTGFFNTAGPATATGTQLQGTAFERTTSQVLSVAYATSFAWPNSGIAKGGFFPSGFNGIINTI